jgi:thiol-disulfide isomerase/thioredoxin
MIGSQIPGKIQIVWFFLIIPLFTGFASVKENDEDKHNLIMNFDSFMELLENDTDTLFVVNFWQTTCKPCIREIPYFNEMYAYYKDYNVKIILLSLDGDRHFEDRLLPFLKKFRIDPEVKLLNAPNFNLWIEKVDEDYWGTIPATLIYNKSKGIRHFINREFEPGELESLLSEILED